MPRIKDVESLAADAKERIFTDPQAFLNKHSLAISNAAYHDHNPAEPNRGTFVMTVFTENGQMTGRDAATVMGRDGKRSAVPTSLRPPAVANGHFGAQRVLEGVYHVPVQNATNDNFHAVHLPAGAGRALMLTTQITACSLALMPAADGGYHAAHIQPSAANDPHARARNGHELHDAMKAAAEANPGMIVFGRHDVMHTRGNIIGVRSDEGQWRFFAQHSLPDGTVTKVTELRPVALGPVVPVVNGGDLVRQALQHPELQDAQRLAPYANVAPLQPGEAVQGKVLSRRAGDGANETCVRDDRDPTVAEHLRPVKRFPTPAGDATYARGQEIHAAHTHDGLQIAVAPTEIMDIARSNPHAIRQQPALQQLHDQIRPQRSRGCCI